jgi:hypothetical protein
MTYIVWVNPKLYYTCDTKDEVEDRLRLLAAEPEHTMVYIFTVSQITTLARYRQEGFLAG